MGKVECNQCGFAGDEGVDTIKLYEDINNKVSNTQPKGDYDIIDACPNCKTDGFLKDV